MALLLLKNKKLHILFWLVIVFIFFELVPDVFGAEIIKNRALVNYQDAHGNIQDTVYAVCETPLAAGPDMKTTITSDAEMAAVGSEIIYIIRYENTGTAAATNFKITSLLSGYITFEEASVGGVYDANQSSNGSVTWIINSVAPGEKGLVTIKVKVKVPADYAEADPAKIKDGVKIINTVKSESNEKKYENTYVITVGESPLLKLNIIQSTSILKPGEAILYKIEYQNRGNVKATNVFINNEVPQLTSFVPESITMPINTIVSLAPQVPSVGSGVINDRIITWNLGALEKNQAGVVSFQARVSELAKKGQQISNVATITGKEQSVTASNQVVAQIINNYSASLKITPSQAAALAGDIVTYTIEAANNGAETLNNVIIKSELPKNVNFVSADNNGRLTGNNMIWQLSQMQGGEKKILTFKLKISDALNAGDFIAQTASINSADLLEPVTAAARVDIVAANLLSDLNISMTSNKNVIFIGETVKFTITLENKGSVMLSNIILNDILPAGLDFIKGSVTSAGGIYVDQQVKSGSLTWNIANLNPAGILNISFMARAGAGINAQSFINSANASGIYNGRSFLTKTVSVKLKVKEGVFSTRSVIAGKVFIDCNKNGMQDSAAAGLDSKTGEIGISGVTIYLEDGTYVTTDENGKYSIFNVSPGTHVLKIDNLTLPAGLKPGAFSSRNAGNGDSMFVDLPASAMYSADFALTGHRDAIEKAYNYSSFQVTGDTVENSAAEQAKKNNQSRDRDYFEKQIISMTPELDFVNIKNGDILASPNSSIIVKADKDLVIKLTVNGIEVPAAQVGKKSVNNINKVALYQFIGVKFNQEAVNNIKLTASDPFGNVRAVKEIKVKTCGNPSALELILKSGNLPADGKTVSVFGIRMYDKDKNILKYPAQITVESTLGEIRNPDENPSEPGVQVSVTDENSKILILSPRETGKADINVTYNKLSAHGKINFVPELKSTMTLGIGEIKIGRGRISGPEKYMNDYDFFKNGGYSGARSAFFTRSRIGRDTLLTASYDSHKFNQDELFRQSDTDVNSEEKYPLAGDDCKLGYDTYSKEKLYLRLDKNLSTLLYGDYYTDLKQNTLSAYNRMFNGIKFISEADKTNIKSFISYTNKTQVIDTLRGKGISGYYKLTNTSIVPGSEYIVIETRYRFQPDMVLKREVKLRDQDYTVDYDLGYVIFKSEVPSLDKDLNPTYLIVSYETESLDKNYYIYGGRGAVKLGPDVELGVTGIREEQLAGDYKLNGADITFKSKNNELKFEWAESGSMANIENGLRHVKDKGVALELKSVQNGKFTYKGFFKTAGDYFKNPSAYDIMAGTRRVSMDLGYAASKNLSLRSSFFKENDMLNSMFYEHFNIGAEKKLEKTKITMDIIKERSKDRFIPVNQLKTRHPFDISEQTPDDLTAVEFTFERLINKRLSFNAGTKRDICHNNYILSSIGADYKVFNSAKLYLRNEYADFAGFNDERLVVGAESEVGKNTTTFSEYRLGNSSSGERMQKSIGLRNKFHFGKQLTGNFSIERLNTIKGPELLLEPDALAFTTAVEYLPKDKLKITGRFEKRKAALEDSSLIEAGAAYEIKPGISFLLRERYFRNWQTSGGKSSSLKTAVCMVLRPVHCNKFNMFLKLELKENLSPVSNNGFDDNALIYSFEGNYKTNARTQFTGKYALKKDRDSTYGGTTDMVAGKVIFDLSSRFDIGTEYRVMNSKASNSRIDGALVEAGYRVKDDMWFSVGHSMQSFDSDLTGDSFDGKGTYAKLRIKFDENSFNKTKKSK